MDGAGGGRAGVRFIAGVVEFAFCTLGWADEYTIDVMNVWNGMK